MAMPFHNNWACRSIRDLMLQEKPDPREVADALSSRPEFLTVTAIKLAPAPPRKLTIYIANPQPTLPRQKK